MASSSAQPGPTPTAPGGGVLLPIPDGERQQYFDNSIWFTLALWPALTVAVSNSFGGPDSADKRDWFAGRISEQFEQDPTSDHDTLVELLLQVMQDEFDVMVEDDSEEGIAGEIMGLRKKVWLEGDREVYEGLMGRWRNRGKRKADIEVVDHGAEEGEWSDFDEEDENDDEDGDVEMGGTKQPVREPREKPAPEIDEDGFEKVVSKKKR